MGSQEDNTGRLRKMMLPSTETAKSRAGGIWQDPMKEYVLKKSYG